MDLSHEKLSKLSTRTDFPKELSGGEWEAVYN